MDRSPVCSRPKKKVYLYNLVRAGARMEQGFLVFDFSFYKIDSNEYSGYVCKLYINKNICMTL